MRFHAIALLVLVSSGCRDGAFGRASRADSVASYREFLRSYPDDADAPAARERLAELELPEAEKVHSLVAYKRFLEEFGETGQAGRAQALLEALRFNAAVERGTSLALRQFLREHPSGAHRAEAEEKLARLELAELGTVDDPATLSGLVARHPDAPAVEEATARLDELGWAKAGSPRLLYRYLTDFPAGRHRDEARARLTSAELDGLLVSNELGLAQGVVERSPLASTIPGLAERFKRAREVSRLLSSRDERILRALPAYTLRPFDELLRALHAPDSMDRWQAAEELGFHVTVKALSPLLEAFRTGRPSLVRQRSADAVAKLLKALPRAVADFEVASRLETLGREASDTQLILTAALLLELSGQLDRAAAEYQRAWDPSAPDPVILRRWAALRLERRQFFSAAVAARQLAIHAAVAAAEGPSALDANARAAARELCSAAEEIHYAEQVLDLVAKEKTDFPDDISAFLVKVREQRRLVDARLRDAELALLAGDAGARRCTDASVAERMTVGEAMRLKALAALKERPPGGLLLLLEVVRERDPSSAVREAAGAEAR